MYVVQVKTRKPRGGLVTVKVNFAQLYAERKLRGQTYPRSHLERIHAAKWFVLSSDGTVYFCVRKTRNACSKRQCRHLTPCPHNDSCSCPDQFKPCKHVFCVDMFGNAPGQNADDNACRFARGCDEVVQMNVAKFAVCCPESSGLFVVRRLLMSCEERFCQNVQLCGHCYHCNCTIVARPCCHIKMVSRTSQGGAVPCTANIISMRLTIAQKLNVVHVE